MVVRGKWLENLRNVPVQSAEDPRLRAAFGFCRHRRQNPDAQGTHICGSIHFLQLFVLTTSCRLPPPPSFCLFQFRDSICFHDLFIACPQYTP